MCPDGFRKFQFIAQSAVIGVLLDAVVEFRNACSEPPIGVLFFTILSGLFQPSSSGTGACLRWAHFLCRRIIYCDSLRWFLRHCSRHQGVTPVGPLDPCGVWSGQRYIPFYLSFLIQPERSLARQCDHYPRIPAYASRLSPPPLPL